MEFSMKNTKPTSTPMSSSIKLDDKISKILSQQDHELYHKMMRKLMFALIAIQINIITAINKLSQYFNESQMIYLQMIKHVFQYLCDSFQLEILYKSINDDLTDYTDTVYTNAKQL